jgi:hypothetical protein
MTVIVLLVLLLIFLFVPQISRTIKSNLDTLPVRFAAVFIVLAALSYDILLALGIFMIIVALYIQHDHDDILSVLGSANNMSAFNSKESNYSKAMAKLDHGGEADESYDSSDFTSKTEDQDNEFIKADSSIDEKHALLTEAHSSKVVDLFPDDTKHVNAMEHGNRNGYSE